MPFTTRAESLPGAETTTGEIPHDKAEPIVAAVVQALRSLVPEEAGDVAAVLPAELRALWQSNPAGGPAEAGRS